MKHNRRLLLSWIIALGLAGLGLLANWYLVYVFAAQPLTENLTPINPYQQLYEDLLYPSVRITTEEGIGSGIIIATTDEHRLTQKDGIYILTAAHVVGNEALVKVELFDSAESLPAFVVSTDTGKDLALLRLVLSNNQQLKTNICPTRLAPKDYVPYIFTPVWVIGCSLGLAPRPTEGCITVAGSHPEQSEGSTEDSSALPQNDKTPAYWEMNASIWPGNSGGGVFLKDTHELIGIAVWVKVCHGQLADTMGGIVSLQTIYEFLTRAGEQLTAGGKRFALTDNLSPKTEQSTPQGKKWGD